MVSSSARQQAFKTSNMTVKKKQKKNQKNNQTTNQKKNQKKNKKKQEFSILIFPVFWKIKKNLGSF